MYGLCKLFKVTGGFRHVTEKKGNEGGGEGGREREGLGCEVNGG